MHEFEFHEVVQNLMWSLVYDWPSKLFTCMLNIEFSKLRFFKLMVAFRAGRCGFYSHSWHLLDRNTHRWKLHDQSKQWYTVYPSSRFDHVICKYLSRSPSSSSNYNPTEDDEKCLWRSSNSRRKYLFLTES